MQSSKEATTEVLEDEVYTVHSRQSLVDEAEAEATEEDQPYAAHESPELTYLGKPAIQKKHVPARARVTNTRDEQPGLLQPGREPVTGDYELYAKFRDLVFNDPTRLPPLPEKKVAAPPTKPTEVAKKPGPPSTDSPNKKKSAGGAKKAGSPQTVEKKSAPLQCEAPLTSDVTADQTHLCTAFWEALDGMMRMVKTPLGFGTSSPPAPEGADKATSTTTEEKSEVDAGSGALQYQKISTELRTAVATRYLVAGKFLAVMDPCTFVEHLQKNKDSPPTFTAEEALEECLHGVRHGMFHLRFGATCKRCANAQVAAATISGVPGQTTCFGCGQENINDHVDQVRVKFIFNPNLFYLPVKKPSCGVENNLTLAARFVALIPLYPRHNYEYELDLPEKEKNEFGEQVFSIISPNTNFKVRLVVDPPTTAADSTQEGEKDEKKNEEKPRLLVPIRASRFENNRNTIHVEHGKLLVRTIQDTDTVAMHVIVNDWMPQEALQISPEHRPAVTTLNKLMHHQTFVKNFPEQSLLGSEQHLQVGETVFCFSELSDMAQQHCNLGNIAALKMARDHFEILFGAIAGECGRVVKTTSSANAGVMSTFPSVAQAVRAMAKAMQGMHLFNSTADCPAEAHMNLRVGIHKGSALMIPLNGINDFFGTTVNTALILQQEKSKSDQIVLTGAAMADIGALDAIERLLAEKAMSKVPQRGKVDLEGITEQLTVSIFKVLPATDDERNFRIASSLGFQNIAPLYWGDNSEKWEPAPPVVKAEDEAEEEDKEGEQEEAGGDDDAKEESGASTEDAKKDGDGEKDESPSAVKKPAPPASGSGPKGNVSVRSTNGRAKE